MGISNQEGHLVLATGNKSELSVGYSTIYGDAVGGYAPIKDVPKTLVWALARWRNDGGGAPRRDAADPAEQHRQAAVGRAAARPARHRLAARLPSLDDVLDDYVERDRSAAELVAAGFDQALVERVLRKTDTAEFKRRQYPPGPKISLKAFGRDRRLPITNRWRERLPDATTPDRPDR